MLRRRLARCLLLVAILGGSASVVPSLALADPVPTFADACGSTNNLDYAVCERLDYLSAESSANDIQFADMQRSLTYLWVGVWLAAGIGVGVWFFRPLGRELTFWGNE